MNRNVNANTNKILAAVRPLLVNIGIGPINIRAPPFALLVNTSKVVPISTNNAPSKAESTL